MMCLAPKFREMVKPLPHVTSSLSSQLGPMSCLTWPSKTSDIQQLCCASIRSQFVSRLNGEDVLEWLSSNVVGERSQVHQSLVLFCSSSLWFMEGEKLQYFQGKSTHQEQMSLIIHSQIRDSLRYRRNLKPSLKNKALCACWGLSERIQKTVIFRWLVSFVCSFSLVSFLLCCNGILSLDFDSLVELNNFCTDQKTRGDPWQDGKGVLPSQLCRSNRCACFAAKIYIQIYFQPNPVPASIFSHLGFNPLFR